VAALRNGDPGMVEMWILTVLSKATLNGVSDVGWGQAERFLNIYRAHVLAEELERRGIATSDAPECQDRVDETGG
jgi:hypothetical protein